MQYVYLCWPIFDNCSSKYLRPISTRSKTKIMASLLGQVGDDDVRSDQRDQVGALVLVGHAEWLQAFTDFFLHLTLQFFGEAVQVILLDDVQNNVCLLGAMPFSDLIEHVGIGVGDVGRIFELRVLVDVSGGFRDNEGLPIFLMYCELFLLRRIILLIWVHLFL